MKRRSIFTEQAVADVRAERHARGNLLEPRPLVEAQAQGEGFGSFGDDLRSTGFSTPSQEASSLLRY